jgi:hypothetical protein
VYWEKDLDDLAFFLAMRSQDEIGNSKFEIGAASASSLLPRRNVYAVVGAGDVGRLAGLLREELADQWLTRTMGALKALPELKDACRIDRDRVWSELTTLGAGLGRPLVVYPETLAQLRAVLAFANGHVPRARCPREAGGAPTLPSPRTTDHGPRTAIPVAVLGAGSNLVGADWEPPRIWVCLRQGEFRGGACREETQSSERRPQNGEPGTCHAEHAIGNTQRETRLWTVGCGVTLRALFEAAAQAEFPCADFAPMAWIPGTVGGAVRMNAGADGAEISQFLVSLEGVTLAGEPWRRQASEIGWGYRVSGVPEDVIVTSVMLRLPVSSPEETLKVLELLLLNSLLHLYTDSSLPILYHNNDFQPPGFPPNLNQVPHLYNK